MRAVKRGGLRGLRLGGLVVEMACGPYLSSWICMYCIDIEKAIDVFVGGSTVR